VIVQKTIFPTQTQLVLLALDTDTNFAFDSAPECTRQSNRYDFTGQCLLPLVSSLLRRKNVDNVFCRKLACLQFYLVIALPGSDADHSLHLVPRPRTSRTYIASPPWRLHGGSMTALLISLRITSRLIVFCKNPFVSYASAAISPIWRSKLTSKNRAVLMCFFFSDRIQNFMTFVRFQVLTAASMKLIIF
jgi:hypothetical protein